MDINAHESEILSLESHLDSLAKLADAIGNAGGMSKGFAMEALALDPSFNNNVPMAYYSNEPTIAQYSTALESIGDAIAKKFKELFGWILKMILRFINWVFPDNGKNSPLTKSKQFDEMVKKLEERDRLIELLNAEIAKLKIDLNKAKGVSTEDMQFGQSTNLNAILDEYIKREGSDSDLARVLHLEDPVLADIMHQGEYTKVIKSCSQAIAVMPVSVSTTANNFLKVIDQVESRVKNSGFRTMGDKDINVDVNPIQMDIFSSGRRVTIDEAVLRLVEIRNNVSKNSQTKPITFTQLNAVFAKAVDSSSVSKILAKMEGTKNAMEDILADLSKSSNTVDNLARRGDADEVFSTYESKLRTGFKTVRVDVMGCFKFFHEIMTYARALHDKNTKLIAVQKAALRVIESEMKRNFSKIPDEIEVLHKQLNESYNYVLN